MKHITALMRSWLPALFMLLGSLTVMADGEVDTTFAPNVNGTAVFTVAMQADGMILIGGSFTTVGGASYTNLARLNADGTVDASFNPSASSTIYSLAVQADGKILVGGGFPGYIARLNADGTVDSNFNGNVSTAVQSTVVQADGKILTAGFFSGITRLNALGRRTAASTRMCLAKSSALPRRPTERL